MSVRYSAGSFIFPGAQPFPHRGCFGGQVSMLDSCFGSLASGSKAFVMGGNNIADTWHLYSASADLAFFEEPIYTSENLQWRCA